MQQKLASLAFCLSLSCSGSSCRDRDCIKIEDVLIFQHVQFIQPFYSFIQLADLFSHVS